MLADYPACRYLAYFVWARQGTTLPDCHQKRDSKQDAAGWQVELVDLHRTRLLFWPDPLKLVGYWFAAIGVAVAGAAEHKIIW